jgi:heat-inducible transcriptional repressor
VTQFGQVHTEILPISEAWSQHRVMRLERYLQWRLSGSIVEERPELDEDETQEDEGIYQELMLRYIVSYSHFMDEELFRCGFSELLHCEDLKDPLLLAGTLSLFENRKGMRHLLREVMKHEGIQVYIGKDLEKVHDGAAETTLISAPYHIGKKSVGAVALLGPNRINYRDWIETLANFTQEVSKKLTDAVYKHQISYRMPDLSTRYLPNQERLWIEDSSKTLLLEDKT